MSQSKRVHDRISSLAYGRVLVPASILALALAPALAEQAREPEDPAALRAGIEVETNSEPAGAQAGGGAFRAERGPAVVAATLIAQDGQTPPGLDGPITSLNSPFTNGLGQVGFTGGATGLAGTDNFVWFDSGVLFLDSTVVSPVLSGAEGTMGIGDAAQFIYSPSADGNDAVWTHNGLLLADNDPAPGFPPGTNNTFNSRPQMGPDGRAYWVAGFNDAGGTSTLGRVLYTSSDATPGNITVVLRSDDMIGGFTIDRPSGIDFDYNFSDNGNHHIQNLLMDTGSTTNDGFVYVDGALVARETDPTGQGDNWDNFDNVSINDSGNYLFSGDTDGATGTDEFIAYNGVIAVREGDVLGGQALTSSASVNALSLNNLGHAVHDWSISGGTEILFFACDASNLAATSVPVLRTGDLVDLDGDTIGDATVTDFNASSAIGPGLSLAEFGNVFIEVDLDYGGGDLEAVIRIDLPLCGAPPTLTVAPPALASTQAPDVVVGEILTLGNTGSLNLSYSIAEAPADCGAPSDLPWASASPTGGVIAPAGTVMVDVTFDSTGLAPGVYTGLLCIASNDPVNPLVGVPLTLTVAGGPSLLEIPTLSTSGLAAFVLLLAALSLTLLRRRRAD